MSRALRVLGVGLCALLAGGCASLEPPFLAHLAAPAPQVRGCAEWFRSLDERVDTAGVRDAQDTRVSGFPYLRVNRLLAALRSRAEADPVGLHALAERMLALDREARRHELANLPAAQLGALVAARDGSGLRIALARTGECARLLSEIDLATPEARAALLERAAVPDDYVSAYRVFGLYALTKLPFGEGVKRYQDDTLAAFRRDPSAPTAGVTVARYAPPPQPRLPRQRVAEILARASLNPLGIPEPAQSELAALYATFAPSFEIEISDDYDRFGRLRWLRGESIPVVDASQSTVYVQHAWTRYRGRVLLQLVYTIWFPERPPQSPGDILAGKLDGLTWRVTLAPDGEPLVYDTIHPCGCFHQFFPTPRAAPVPAPGQAQEWLFTPQALPRMAEGERPVLRVATRTHYIERISVVRGGDSAARYSMQAYDGLRSLERPDGGSSSVFGPDGLVAGTERPERLLFWPMGIRSAGAMRQWGRHATAFIGRRHFDDADLLEKRFKLDF